MVEQTRAEFGRIDILVNNAGIYRAAETLDVTEEHWDAIMNINAKGVFFASQAVLPTEHPNVATTLDNLAALYRLQGRDAEAEPLSKRGLAIREKTISR